MRRVVLNCIKLESQANCAALSERPDTVAASQNVGCILQRSHLKADYVTATDEGCPNSKAVRNAALKCGLHFPEF